jgi:hypothetical protein
MITIFCLSLFGQLSFKLLFMGKEDRVKLAYFFQHIFKNLGLYHLLYRNLQELNFVLRLFVQCLYKEKIRSMSRRSSMEGCKTVTSIWAVVVIRLE